MRRLTVARLVALPLVASGLVFGSAAAAHASNVDPATVTQSVDPGGSYGPITKTVTTPAIPPKPDVLILADTTGSMGPTLAGLQTGIASLITQVQTAQPDAQFGVADYKDLEFCPSDPYAYQLDQAITSNTTDVSNAVSALSAGGGCDDPESQLNALYSIANDTPPVGWRTGSTRIVAWFGDSNGHDPSFGHSLTDVENALTGSNIRVIAVPIDSGFGNGLDSTGQATAIAGATGGTVVTTSNPSDVANAILSGLQNLPVTVEPSVTCDSGLSTTLTPASQTVTSGDDATFQETISVDANATQGATLGCTVDFLLNGTDSGADFTETITIHVNDITAPTAACTATTNPSGRKTPTAGTGTGSSGMNPDGFYQMTYSDNVGVQSAVIADSASSFTVAVANGEKDKLVQAPTGTPNWKPGTGVITKKITTKGDPYLVVTDTSGNVTTVACLVPPPPK